MLTNNDAYGKSEHDAFLSQLKSTRHRPVADQVVTPDATDMTGALSKIRDANPEVLFIGAEEMQSGLAVKQARSLGIKAVIAEGAPASTPLYVSTAGAANVEGTIVSSPYLSNDRERQTRAFSQAYKKAWSDDPELHGAKAYDGMMILADRASRSQGQPDGRRSRGGHAQGQVQGAARQVRVRRQGSRPARDPDRHHQEGKAHEPGRFLVRCPPGGSSPSDGLLPPLPGLTAHAQPSVNNDMNHILQTAVGGISIGAVYALVALGFSIVFQDDGPRELRARRHPHGRRVPHAAPSS